MGQHEWKVNVSENPYYTTNETSVVLVVNVVGDLINTIEQPDGSTNYTKGQQILLRGFVKDDCNLNLTSLDKVYFNLTSQLTGETYQCDAQGENNGYYNCTWNSSNKPVGWYTVKFYSEKSYYNPGIAGTTFYLSSAPELIAWTVEPSSGGWGVPSYVYRVNVTDIDNDTVLSLIHI